MLWSKGGEGGGKWEAGEVWGRKLRGSPGEERRPGDLRDSHCTISRVFWRDTWESHMGQDRHREEGGEIWRKDIACER